MQANEQANIPAEVAFSVSPRTAVLLGRESISSPVVAVTELVKNAYDADASKVTVRFRKASTRQGTIEIRDDGEGMTLNDILTKWMVIGTDFKEKEPISPKGRTRVGEKGIGRFALDRLAEEVVIETTPEHEDEPRYRLGIDWARYEDRSGDLGEIKHPLKTLKRWKSPGTVLKLSNLRDRWTRRDYDNLYKNLVILIPPFEQLEAEFRIFFDCDETPDLSGEIESPIAEAALFSLSATLDKSGLAKIAIKTREGDPKGAFRLLGDYERKWSDLFDLPPAESEIPESGPLGFDLYFYLRESDALRETDVTLSRLREFLNVYGGVRIYRDGFRIKPYGDPGSAGDWLGLSARRVQNPAGVRSRRHPRWVVAENQVVGSLNITRNKNPNLRDQTNREGLFANDAFLAMQRFVLKCIEIFEIERKRHEMEKLAIGEEDIRIGNQIDRARSGLEQDIDEVRSRILSKPNSVASNDIVGLLDDLQESQAARLKDIEAAADQEEQEQISERQLYQNLATIGIAVSAMGHEVIGIANKLQRSIDELRKEVQRLKLAAGNLIVPLLDQLDRYSQIIYSMSRFALSHIDRDKRHRKKFMPDELIESLYKETLVELAVMNEASIEFLAGGVPAIFSFPYELESIVMNFTTNALAAFVRGRTPIKDRRIEIETIFDSEQKELQIISRDTGPGIDEEDIPRVFNLYSTKLDAEGRPIGSGLGLKIVKDIVNSYGGRVEIKSHGEKLAGAEIVAILPIKRLPGDGRSESGRANQ